MQAYKKAFEIDPFMWCAYEKICRQSPTHAEPGKMFSELNPKMMLFLKKNNNYNFLSNQKNTKDFELSPDSVANKQNNLINKNLGSSELKFNVNTNTSNNTNNLNKKQVHRFELIHTSVSNTTNHNNNNNIISEEKCLSLISV